MKFRFIGDAETCENFGFVFKRGQTVDVPDDLCVSMENNALVAEKLAGHPEFEAVKPRKKAKKNGNED